MSNVHRRHATRFAASTLVLFLGGMMLLPQAARSQSLLDLFRHERVRTQAEQMNREFGNKVRAHSPAMLPFRGDTLYAWLTRTELVQPPIVQPPEEYLFDAANWRAIKRLQRAWFNSRFDSVSWGYLGNSEGRPLDTTWTRELRGRLEARFGQPTQTVLEPTRAQNKGTEEMIQFEYWLVLNDSIPVRVLDTGGPFDRGLVLASDQKHRRLLGQMRYALWTELSAVRPEQYVDYYYDAEERAWYRTGYEAGRYTTARIRQPDLARGRPRPGVH